MLLELPNMLEEVLTVEQFVSAEASALRTEDRAMLERDDGRLWGTYVGRLRLPSHQAYARLDEALRAYDMYALFRQEDAQTEQIQVHLIVNRPPERKGGRFWLPFLLFVATIVSVLLTGTLIAAGEIGLSNPHLGRAIAAEPFLHLWRGIPYAFAILLILGSHELGHYFTMRYYGLAGSVPYFIPAPFISPFGTFGAAIALRDNLHHRNMLFDLGASGPIAGMVFAVPILLIGLGTSPVLTVSGGLVEGNSILYAGAKILMLGEFLPADGRDVLLNQWAWAGWTGLFVTALNLIPLGQLDGGHVLYALLGRRARWWYHPILALTVGLAIFLSSAWLVLGILLTLVGRYYALPLDDVTPLSRRRRWLAIGLLVMFALIFTPIPIGQSGVNNGLIGLL